MNIFQLRKLFGVEKGNGGETIISGDPGSMIISEIV
jgi:hypothetical protein